jgi:hypothetical protein
MKIMSQKDLFLTVIGLLAYGVWGAIAFLYDHTQIDGFLSSVKYIATGVVVIVVRDMQPAKNDNGDAAP